jgi:hypothetical protein
MPTVTLKEPFRYWRQGCWPEDYPAGVVEMDDEAAKAAHDCGVVADEAAKPKGGKK